jgi:hypothetical protein
MNMQFNFNLEGRNLFTYEAYRTMLDSLMADGKTTGSDQSEAMIEYAKMNIVRMNRWDKTAQLSEELKNVLASAPKQKWIVLNEGWCGDAAQNLPILHKMAEQSEQIELQIILRDENLDIMDAYLTNGGRSIPKLIAIDENNEVLFTWGPRPQKMQDVVIAIKKEGGDYANEVHKMYARDKAASLQSEFMNLLSAKLV